MIDQLRTRLHELITRPQLREMRLRLLAPMANGVQQLHIDASEARQVRRIHAVITLGAAPRAVHRTRIGHVHVMPVRRQLATHPRRVRPHFQHDARGGPRPEEAL